MNSATADTKTLPAKAELNPPSAVGCSDLLDRLRIRFKERAEMNRGLEAEFVKNNNYYEAEKCVIRRDIWESAAEMLEQEKRSNSISVEVPRSSSCLIFTILRLSNSSVKLIYGA